MAKKNRIGLQFTGWQELMRGIDKVAGEEGLKKATESALKSSKNYVNQQANALMVKSNMPARGKYWRDGETKAALRKDMTVKWSGFTGEIKIGFDLEKSGLKSIFLMYGTPRMNPVPGLKDAFYGRKTKTAITHLQREAIEKWIERNL